MPLPSPLTLAATNAASTCWSAIRRGAGHAARLASKAGARAAVLAAMCAASSTHAAIVSISFGGFVTEVSDGLNLLNGLAPNGKNTRFTGGLSWDTSTPDSLPGTMLGAFNGAVTNFWLDFGNGLVFTQGGPQTYNNVQTRNDGTDYGGQPFDGFYAYAQWNGPGFSYTELGVSMQSLLLSALASDGLPGALNIADFLDPDDLFPADAQGVDRQGAGIEFHAVGPVTSAFSTNLYGVIDTASTVPEPGSWALAGIALLGLVAARRRPRS